ncbi:MAG TPA: hypothetical protein VGO36_03205 [Solirubrobacterales bacterium]|jgi:hypothetical protein|nr:hypothetical protein [Solirubrobacterales bacterium]
MQKNVLRTVSVVILAALFCAASAYALKIEIGKTIVSATATISPRALPAQGGAPVEVESVTRVKTTDGSTPPSLRQLVFVFDKHGFVDTKGLPVCTEAKLAGTTPQVARKRCAGAIVGEGVGKAEVTLPGAAPVEISSPLTFFNAPPTGGRPSLIIHAYEKIPSPKAVLLPVVVERVNQARYGYRVQIDVPPIADGYGAPTLAKATIGASWKRGGKTVGYTNAYCDQGRLQVHGTLRFTDGSFFPGTLTSPCHVSD